MIFGVTAFIDNNILGVCKEAGFADVYDLLNAEIIKNMFKQAGLEFKECVQHD